MRRRSLSLLIGVLLSLVFPIARPAHAQDVGGAIITFPVAGHPVSGRFAVTGTAVMSQFDRYELSFAHDPNPTETWFYIAEAARSPVSNDILAEWDVSGITDGNYMLRLRVFSADGTFLDAVVRGIIVRNNSPTEVPAPTDTPAPAAGATATPGPAATASPTPLTEQLPTPFNTLPPQGAGDGSPSEADQAIAVSLGRLSQAFWSGVRWTVVAFILLGAYVGLRSAFRSDLRRWVKRLWAAMQR